ncbi:hypothetical protein FACS1894206_07540 [Deltaproteobacteria bacterium]|nr:hypothetical protein FACS1894206_07540 [Deltaproteobacteria bacterium]
MRVFSIDQLCNSCKLRCRSGSFLIEGKKTTIADLRNEECNRFVKAVEPLCKKPAYAPFSEIARRIRETQ